jgi:hypothetical protein
MSDVMTDRRDSPRYALVAIVTESATSNVMNARSSDVSRSGCYVDTLQPLPTGTHVKILPAQWRRNFRSARARRVYVPWAGDGRELGLGSTG